MTLLRRLASWFRKKRVIGHTTYHELQGSTFINVPSVVTERIIERVGRSGRVTITTPPWRGQVSETIRFSRRGRNRDRVRSDHQQLPGALGHIGPSPMTTPATTTDDGLYLVEVMRDPGGVVHTFLTNDGAAIVVNEDNNGNEREPTRYFHAAYGNPRWFS